MQLLLTAKELDKTAKTREVVCMDRTDRPALDVSVIS
jgi:hypothetical protein